MQIFTTDTTIWALHLNITFSLIMVHIHTLRITNINKLHILQGILNLMLHVLVQWFAAVSYILIEKSGYL